MNYRSLALAVCACLLSFTSLAEGYEITVEVPGYAEEEIYLGFFLMENQYVKDTASAIEEGKFVFEGEESLEPGFYIVVFPPDNQYLQLLIPNTTDQNIHLFVGADQLTRPTKVIGSPDTEMFYEYASFISEMRPIAEDLRKELDATQDEAAKDQLAKQLEELNVQVQNRQNEVITEHPASLTAMLIKANMDVDIPEFAGEDANEKAYSYYRAHYFDNIALGDPRITRTPFIAEKVDYYLDKLTYQQPDSLIEGIDHILAQVDPESEAFQVFLVGFLNEYAASKIVGMDAVYVHLIDKYYATGIADWTSEEQLDKLIETANTLRPILIGEIAPEITVFDREKNPVDLHSIESPYTVVYFWDPECGHCKKSIPLLIEFYEEYQSKGVEVLAICTKLGEGEKSCWEAVDERGMDIWMNASDAFLRSRFKQKYDVSSTPQVYVLDQNKKIIMKKIGADQLSRVMDHFLEEKS